MAAVEGGCDKNTLVPQLPDQAHAAWGTVREAGYGLLLFGITGTQSEAGGLPSSSPGLTSRLGLLLCKQGEGGGLCAPCSKGNLPVKDLCQASVSKDKSSISSTCLIP